MKRKRQKKKPLSWWAVLAGLILIILQITDKVLDVVLKILDRVSE